MFKVAKKILATLLLLFAFSSIVFSQTNQYPKTFLWRISGNGLQKPSYLYGTIHVTEKRAFFFGDSLYKCLEKVEGYAAELDMDSLTTYITNNYFKASNKKSKLLKDILDKTTFKKISSKLSKKLNIPANDITTDDIKNEKNKAYSKSMKNGEMSGFMDAYLNTIAKKQGKWTGGIEDLADQMGIDDDKDENIDPEFLLQKASDDDETFLNALIKIYIDQNLQGIYDMYNNYSLAFKKTFIDNRNIKMARRLDSLAHIRSMFFTMGVAHLPGSDGVIELLKQKGFIVEPVFSSKTIAPEKYKYTPVETIWFKNYDKDSSYSFKTPGAASILPIENLPLDMYMYMDLGTTTAYYSIASAIATSLGNNTDTILDKMVNGMAARGGNLISKKKIVFKENDGVETLSYSEGESFYMRTIAFIKNKKAYLHMFGSKNKEDCYGKDADYFLNSVEIYNQPSNVKTALTVITDTSLLFSATFPGREYKEFAMPLNLEDDLQNWNYSLKAFIDNDFSNIYMLLAKITKPGYYIESDTTLYNLLEKQLLLKKATISRKEMIDFKGNKALALNGILKDSTIYYRSVNIIKANRSYSLISMSFTQDTIKAFDFINSFKLLEAEAPVWSINYVNNIFSTWSPSLFTVVDTSTKSNFISYNKATTASYEVLKETMKRYDYWESDTAFLNYNIKQLKRDQDSLLSSHIAVTENKVIGNFRLTSPNSYTIKDFQVLLQADTLYTLSAISPAHYTKDSNHDNFFSSFKLLQSPSTPITVFTDKADQLIADIQSKDSAIKEIATSSFYAFEFKKNHLPALHKMLFSKYTETSWYESPCRYAEIALLKLADSSTIDLIKANYNLPDSSFSIDKAQMLALLLRMKNNNYAEKTAKQILLTNPPTNGSINEIGYQLNVDSGKNVAFIMQLMPLTKDSLWAFTLANVARNILDSNYIAKNELLIFEENFIKEANRRIQLLKAIDTFDFSMQYYPLPELMASYNTSKSNAVLQHFLEVKHLEVISDASLGLIKNNQSVDASTIKKLASNDRFRVSIYNALKEKKKLSLFPKQFATQKYFASAYLTNFGDESDNNFSKLEFIKEKNYSLNGKKLKFYLYRVSYSEEESYLAIVGGFNMLAGKLEIEDETTGLYYDEQFDKDAIDEQFIAFIKGFEKSYKDEMIAPVVEDLKK